MGRLGTLRCGVTPRRETHIRTQKNKPDFASWNWDRLSSDFSFIICVFFWALIGSWHGSWHGYWHGWSLWDRNVNESDRLDEWAYKESPSDEKLPKQLLCFWIHRRTAFLDCKLHHRLIVECCVHLRRDNCIVVVALHAR